MINTLLEMGIIILLIKVAFLLGLIIKLKKDNAKQRIKYEYWREKVIQLAGTERLQKELDKEVEKHTTGAPWLKRQVKN